MTGQMEEISVYSAGHIKLEDEVSAGHLHGLSGYIIEIESKKCLVMQLTDIGFAYSYKSETFEEGGYTCCLNIIYWLLVSWIQFYLIV
jgi:hypothetical protein